MSTKIRKEVGEMDEKELFEMFAKCSLEEEDDELGDLMSKMKLQSKKITMANKVSSIGYSKEDVDSIAEYVNNLFGTYNGKYFYVFPRWAYVSCNFKTFPIVWMFSNSTIPTQKELCFVAGNSQSVFLILNNEGVYVLGNVMKDRFDMTECKKFWNAVQKEPKSKQIELFHSNTLKFNKTGFYLKFLTGIYSQEKFINLEIAQLYKLRDEYSKLVAKQVKKPQVSVKHKKEKDLMKLHYGGM